MVLMLPRPTDNGARLAAILPTALASLARGLDRGVAHMLDAIAQGREQAPNTAPLAESDFTPVRSVVLVVVDGLGHANLKAMSGHARALSSLPTKRIETVIPSTTGAALTTITTGALPGEHGLIGYRIRHPELGLITTLKDWQGITDPSSWQRVAPLFSHASGIGARAVAIGRPAHAVGGLTEAILAGAEYLGGQTIAERFSIASGLLRSGDPILAYLYVDELDRVAHSDGWQTEKWVRRLEQLDAALDDLLRTLPGDVGIVITADHGMIDVPVEKRLMLDRGLASLDGVVEIGGEPRMRSIYLDTGVNAAAYADELQRALAKLAWVGTRESAIDLGWFGPVDDAVAPRLGDVLVAARGRVAFTLSTDSDAALNMVGQHGGISDEERGVPVALAGAFAGTSFVSSLAEIAKRNRA